MKNSFLSVSFFLEEGRFIDILGTYTLNAKGRFVTIFMLMVILLGVCGVLNPIVSMDAYACNIFDIVDNTGAIDPTAGGVSAADNTADSIATVLTKGKAIALGFTGVATLLMLAFTIIQIVKLAAAGDNEMNRKRAIGGILTTGIATALLGGLSVFVGFFWGALK